MRCIYCNGDVISPSHSTEESPNGYCLLLILCTKCVRRQRQQQQQRTKKKCCYKIIYVQIATDNDFSFYFIFYSVSTGSIVI